jgi:uncharacterized protein
VAVNPYKDSSLPISALVRDQIKTFMLPVSGAVRLYGPEVSVVDTPEFQRLDGIKQLGTSYLVYRGARHTRFEHSLGTLHEAERMLGFIENNPKRGFTIEPQARRLVRLAALLHDLPHVPFGHTLEDELGLLKRHDENGPRLTSLLDESGIGSTLKEALGEGEFALLKAVLLAKTDEQFAALEYPYVADIVGNTLCSDLLDYVRRDLHYCGMPVGIGDYFLSFLTVTGPSDTAERRHQRRLALMLDKKGMPRPDVESEVVKLLEARYELAERVYNHHAKTAASVMLGRAIISAGLARGPDHPDTVDERFVWLSDDVLLQILREPSLVSSLQGWEGLPALRPVDLSQAKKLSQAIQARRLYKIVYLAPADDLRIQIDELFARYRSPEARFDLENRLADLAGIARGQILMHLPRPTMMTKDADVRVITSAGSVMTLGEWDKLHNRRIAPLNDAHRRLWRLVVYLDPEIAADSTIFNRVRDLCEDMFVARSRVSSVKIRAFVEGIFRENMGEREWTHEDREALVGMAAHETASTYNELIDLIEEKITLFRQREQT